jgi:protein tyrosine/serine phosphatase
MRLIAVALILTSQLAWAEPIRFMPVTASLFRSGQAETDGDFEAYKRAGIKTIIDLRQGKAADVEREQATRLGFRYINIPLNIASTPSDYLEAERKFFAVVDDPANGRVVFHCRHGKDRTGLMAALYRVNREGWSAERAIAEWKSHGGYAEDWGNGIQDYFNARMRMTRAAICSELF